MERGAVTGAPVTEANDATRSIVGRLENVSFTC